MFLWKLDNSGNFAWVNDFGGNYSTDQFGFSGDLAISPDSEANNQMLIVADRFNRTSDFDPGPGTNYLNPDSGSSFMAKYGANGELIWAGNYGLDSSSQINTLLQNCKLAVDSSEEIFFTGNYNYAPDINPGAGGSYYLPFSTPAFGKNSSFVAKLSGSGNVIWSKIIYYDTTSTSSANGGIVAFGSIALDANNPCYIVGGFSNRIGASGFIDFDPGPGMVLRHTISDVDVFVLKLDALGNFEWVSTTQGYPNNWGATGDFLFLDQYNNIYIEGRYMGAVDFDPGLDTFLMNSIGYSHDGFILKLTQCPLTVDSTAAAACNQYTIGGQVFDSSGTYTVALPSSVGACDSIVVLDLSLEPLENTLSRNGDTLIANARLATYQWLSCDNFGNKTPILGASSKRYRPTTEGEYAVAVSYQDCRDTSGCRLVDNLSIADLKKQSAIQIVPNPTTSQCKVLLGAGVTPADLKLINTLGAVVWEKTNFSGKSQTIDMSQMSAGIYYLTIREKGSLTVKKVVKW